MRHPHHDRFGTADRSPAQKFRMAAGALSLLLVSALVATTSRAAFTSSTSNSGNSLAAASVLLVDGDLGGTRFTVTNMEPGRTVTGCIVVTYNGTVDPSVVRMYSGGYVDPGNFADDLNVTVDEGTGGTYADCIGFTEDDVGAEFADTLTQFDTLHTSYATGFGEWDPTGPGQSKTYRITIELDATTPDAERNESGTVLDFTWEVRN